jgi:hypothetical protein
MWVEFETECLNVLLLNNFECSDSHTPFTKVLVEKPEGKRQIGRPMRRWEDNFKVALREVGFGGSDWIELAKDTDRWRALVNAVMNIRVP